MKKLQTFSFHLHWVTLCCFLLPFFYDSCTNEKKPEEAFIDTSVVVVPVGTTLDSMSQKNNSVDSTKITSIDTTATEPTNQKDELLSETIIKKYPILEPILIPDSGTHTGLATIVNSIQFVPLFAPTITFLLLLISLFAKRIDENGMKIFLILEVFATAFLMIARPPFFSYDLLWGYWLSLFCISALTIIDAYIAYKQKREEI